MYSYPNVMTLTNDSGPLNISVSLPENTQTVTSLVYAVIRAFKCWRIRSYSSVASVARDETTKKNTLVDNSNKKTMSCF